MVSLRSDSTRGLNPVPITSVTYLGAIVVFLLGSNLRGLPEFKQPGPGAWLPETLSSASHIPTFITMAAWGEHYVRRFAEVLFVHNYKRKMTWVESFGAPLYYWLFGFFIGWSVNYKLSYHSPHLGFYCAGLALFIAGEVGNCVCHVMLKNLRKPPDSADETPSLPTSSHVIPRGFLFELVSCPHYFCEIVTWFGFLMMTFTLAVALFLLASVITLISLSKDKHKAYTDEFNGDNGKEMYPPSRKALIPFIL
ncbi:very-long-chain enoyl-CoA reductase-like [Liolophura sinensis]|uniref:very-long-chain enoyl-CoA reductase-like n=1 Tax=Liolophura sinensis TaxID=3198878 RepID=UPI0031582422